MNDITLAKRFVRLYQSASTRGIECSLPMAAMRSILNAKKCYYTGHILNNIEDSDYQLTLDRVDNSLGYIKGNVVACSRKFNLMKGSISNKEIEILYNKVIRKRT